MGATLREDSLVHQSGIQELKEKYLILAILQWKNNLKLRGVEESTEGREI